MKCERIKEQFPEFLTGEIDQKFKAAVQDHLAVCDSCREELESLSAVWTKLGVIPEEQPGSEMRTRFYTMLEAYKQGMEQEERPFRLKKFVDGLFDRIWPRRPAFQFSLTLIFLIVGLATGYLITVKGRSATEIALLKQEVTDMRQTLAVSLLDRPSASDRLQGVSMSSGMDSPSAKILDALLDTLDNDPNVNVRMAAVDALYLFHGHPGVKQGLIRSLSNQTSPLVQVALIDLIVSLQERRAVEALRTLIRDNEISPEVRDHAEQRLQELSF
ncbi:MAG: HEAT repeat domain-containing protein [Candidatus Aminicenantes bacterium]|nr:HEAT repeat domain-containing protein [Candidatus Aminicenantes bacterium]